jgi:hypothetical protein
MGKWKASGCARRVKRRIANHREINTEAPQFFPLVVFRAPARSNRPPLVLQVASVSAQRYTCVRTRWDGGFRNG